MELFKKTKHIKSNQLGYECTEFANLINPSKILSINNKDSDNLFAIAIQTPPKNSRGTPHILEHCVLGGSKKFPVKEPFQKMLSRCFSTFLNAFTMHDTTCYVVSSQDKDSFYKLCEVIIDAVFNPLLLKGTFLQEGFRIQIENNKLIPQGVVFNEMKGAMSSSSEYIWEIIKGQLFQGRHYIFNYGGNPVDITSITHSEMVSFHNQYYSPDRALFFFYGDIPVQNNINFLLKNIAFKKSNKKNIEYREQTVSQNFKHIDTYYPKSSSNDCNIFAMAWIIGPSKDPFNQLLAHLLDKMLTQHDMCLLSKKLIEQDFCEQINTTIIEDMSDVVMFVEFINVNLESCESCEEVVIRSIEEICNEQINPELIKASINQIIFEYLEIAISDDPYGLRFLFKNVVPYFWGADFVDNVYPHQAINKLSSLNQQSIKSNINERLTDEEKFVSGLFKPQIELNSAIESAINIAVKSVPNYSSWDELVTRVEKDTKILKDMHEASEDLSALPIVNVDKNTHLPVRYKLEEKSKNTYLHLCQTNNFVYIHLIFPIHGVDENEIMRIKLIVDLLDQIGVENQDLNNFFNEKDKYFSVFEFNIEIIQDSENNLKPYLVMETGFKVEYIKEAIDFINRFISKCDLSDTKRNSNLIKQTRLDSVLSINEDAFDYCKIYPSSCFNNYAKLENIIDGIDFYKFILSTKEEDILDGVRLTKSIFDSGHIETIITCQEKDEGLVLQEIKKIEHKNTHIDFGISIKTEDSSKSFAFLWESNISHNCISLNLEAKQNISNISFLDLFAAFITNQYLLNNIREKSGAYGTGARFVDKWNSLVIYSYRDPNVKKTLQTFQNSILQRECSALELEDAKRSVIQRKDRPLYPIQKAMSSWINLKEGKTEEKLIEQRVEMIDMSLNKFKSIFDSINLNLKEKYIVSIAPKRLIDDIGGMQVTNL